MHLQSLFWFGLLVGLVALLYRRILGLTRRRSWPRSSSRWTTRTGCPPLDRGTPSSPRFSASERCSRRTAGSGKAGVRGPRAAPLRLSFPFRGERRGDPGLSGGLRPVPRTGSAPRRLGTLLPYLVILVLWRGLAASAGFGTAGMKDFYLDPGAEPFRFLGVLPKRAYRPAPGPVDHVPADVSLFVGPNTYRQLWLAALAVVAALALLFTPLLRREPAAVSGEECYSLVPDCTTFLEPLADLRWDRGNGPSWECSWSGWRRRSPRRSDGSGAGSACWWEWLCCSSTGPGLPSPPPGSRDDQPAEPPDLPAERRMPNSLRSRSRW